MGAASGLDEGAGADVARDRYIDLLRVASMLAVALLHWLSVVPRWDGGRLTDRNVVELVPGLWPITWVGDVMPVFFFVGGYAGWVVQERTVRSGRPVSAAVARRVRRLVAPTIAFLGAYLAVDLLFRLGGLARYAPLSVLRIGSTTPFGPLWFVGVYLVVILLGPVTVAAHRRWGWAVPVWMTVAVAACDVLGIGLHVTPALVANLVLVWLVPHQLGYFYADGRLRRLPRAAAAMATGGMAGLVLLTGLPWYSRALVAPGRTVLTLDAATLPLVAASFWLVGLAVLLQAPARRRLARPATWRVVSSLNRVAMPVYLWHMTAFLPAVLVLGPLAVAGAGPAPAAVWWWGRLPVLALSVAMLSGLLAVGYFVSRDRAPRGVRLPSR